MQQRIIDFLKKQKKPVGRIDIAKKLKESPTKVSDHIRRLLKHDEIKCIEISRAHALEHYNCKRRMRLYYID